MQIMITEKEPSLSVFFRFFVLFYDCFVCIGLCFLGFILILWDSSRWRISYLFSYKCYYIFNVFFFLFFFNNAGSVLARNLIVYIDNDCDDIKSNLREFFFFFFFLPRLKKNEFGKSPTMGEEEDDTGQWRDKEPGCFIYSRPAGMMMIVMIPSTRGDGNI